MNTTSIDIGPLTWVKGEIDLALDRAGELLRQLTDKPGDPGLVAQARNQLHQAHGALAIVGLDGITQYSEALEALLAALESGEIAFSPDTLAAAEGGLTTIRHYLDDLVAGNPDQPLRLYPHYAQLLTLRGQPEPPHSDLFFPDLTLRPPKRDENPTAIPEQELGKRLKGARMAYQKGLLKWLRNQPDGLAEMRAALDRIELTQTQPVRRTLWWAAQGMIDALAGSNAEASNPQLRKLNARLDTQIRKLIEGSTTIAERLLRDVLYQVAVAPAGGTHLEFVRAAFQLDEQLPRTQENADAEAKRPLIAQLREFIGNTKDDWNRFCSGTAAALPRFHQHIDEACVLAVQLEEEKFTELVNAISDMAEVLRKDPLRNDETVALEIATALLLAESGLSSYPNLGADFPAQVDNVAARLGALSRGESLTELAIPQLGEIARHAQERLLMAHVVREITTNLATIEQSLDAFFRNPTVTEGLASLRKPLDQVAGALAVLGQESASRLLQECDAKIRGFAAGGDIPQSAFEEVAAKLSALGFFVEQLRHGPANLEAILNPRRNVAEEDVSGPSLEASLDVTKRLTQTLVGALRDSPEDSEIRDELKQQLESLREDAQLIADDGLEQQLNTAIAALDENASTPELEEAIASIVETPAAIEPSAEIIRLANVSSDVLDTELLSIFLEEANEVLGTLGETLPQAAANPHDHEALTTVRRSFHTLKGSGRMVGLTDLGEVAWTVERVMNGWLQQEADGTPELITMLGNATAIFTEWVRSLESGAHASPEIQALLDQCSRLQLGDEDSAPIVRPQSSGSAAATVAAAVASITDAVLPESPPDAAAVAALPVPDDVPEAPATPPQESAKVIEFPSPAPIEIGELAMTPVLFDTYLNEARAHINAMQEEFAEEGKPPSSDLLRAAHTLGGISATVGIEPIRSLVNVLEDSLTRFAAAAQGIPFSGRAVIARAIGALDGMIGAIGGRRMPSADHGLEAALAELQPDGADTEDESAAPPTPVPLTAEDLLADAHTFDFNAGTPAEAGSGLADTAPPAADAPAWAAPEAAPEFTPESAAGPAPDLIAAFEAEPEPALAPVPEPEAVLAAHEAVAEPPAEESVEVDELEFTVVEDEIDDQLLPIFLEESVDLMQGVGVSLRDWRDDRTSRDAAEGLQRQLHTLKGSARMAGAMTLGELVHAMETRVERGMNGRAATGFLDMLDAAYDRTAHMLDRLRRGEPALEPVVVETAAGGAIQFEGGAANEAVVSHIHQAQDAPRQAQATAEAVAGNVLRVRAKLVDELVNSSGEIAITRSRIEGEVRTLKDSLLDLTENVIRLRNQLREIEIQAESQMQSQQSLAQEQLENFDPLEFDRFTRFQELTRMMAESVNDVSTIQHNLLRNLENTDAALVAQARLNRDLSQSLMSVRMVPFNSVADRLYRIVRQSAKDAGKRANLDIRGAQTELDRSVLDTMIGPIEHLLRNAVAHGLEDVEKRRGSTKSEIGEITISVSQTGNEVVIVLADDGGGLDYERIRAIGEERGLIGKSDMLDEQALTELIFTPGFSTASEVTALAGRGIGMDVVKSEVQNLGGRIEVESNPGRGSRFAIFLPLTLAIAQGVMVRVGLRTFILPAGMVAQVNELKPAAIETVRKAGATEWQGVSYGYHYLPRLLGETEAMPEPARRHWLLLLRTGTQHLALEVDQLLGNQEVVVKNIGPQLSRVTGIVGATVLGDGEIALIINPIALTGHKPRALPAAPVAPVEEVEASASVNAVPTVLVVDDSLTVRKITGRLLERSGYRVVTAKDGIDALEQMVELVPDVMLVDIEMPRMDGFDLTRNVRADARLQEIPIIMITSRTADKHRKYAAEIGVNHYLGKPYDEEELLRAIAGYVKATATA